MMKYRVVCLFVTFAAGICLATAQDSQVRSASPKSGPDPLQTATKPLTPKSAMPPQRKSSAAVPNPATANHNTTAELTHLERQNIKAPSAKSNSTGPAKSAPKSAGTSAANGSGINFKYQKPAGGTQAPNPGANARSSGAPRVKKN
jgi:hypothetical protein